MTDIQFGNMIGRELFIELVASGVSLQNAALQAGWTPRQLKRELADKDFLELVDAAEERLIGSVEETLVAVARRGNVAAISMFLLNRAPDRWRDIKRIEIKNDVSVSLGMVASVKQGALELLREQGVAALQQIEAPIIDAEVVE